MPRSLVVKKGSKMVSKLETAGAVVFDGGEDVGAAAGHADGEAARVGGERNAAGSGAVRVWVGELLHGLDAVGDEIHEYLL